MTNALGRYEIHKQIGAGGMSEVFLALDAGTHGLDRWVAIKKVHPELAAEPRFAAMLLDEARLAARISHPNVAQVIDLGEAEGTLYLVMEYLRGQPLSALIERTYVDSALADLDLMCRIVADTCEGAHAAHELYGLDGKSLGLVHRDLSPHNIFVTYDGAVKVVDFGIAKAVGRSTHTAPGTRKGKFSYMSPEQLLGENVDRTSDVYALGLVLYEATTGRRAFDGITDLEERMRGAEVEKPSRLRKNYPKVLEAIVERAIDRRREARFQTARELGQELERFLVERRALTSPAQIAELMSRAFPTGQSGEQAPRSEPRLTETRLAPKRRARGPMRRISAIVAAGLVLSASSVLIAMGFDEPEPAPESAPAPIVEVTEQAIEDPVMLEPVVLEEEEESVAPTEPLKKRRVVERGTLDVKSVPWANVFVDGRSAQATPIVGLPVKAGAHVIRLVTPDGRSKRVRVKIAAGRATTLDVKF